MKLKLLLIPLFASIFCSLLIPIQASATDYGTINILDDAVMNNTGSMSAAQINTFLNSFAGTCLGSNSGFTTADPQGYSNGAYQYGGATDAGTAIAHIAARYNLSPQVLLATLEKEQGLVDTTTCHPEQQGDAPAFYSWSLHKTCIGNGTPYSDCGPVTCGPNTAYSDCSYGCMYSGGCATVALGYSCPGFCKKSFATFSGQISGGSWVLRFTEARAYGQLTGYAGYDSGDESIGYSGPMTAGYRQRVTGGASVFYDGSYTDSDGNTMRIANGATASMLSYTPFYARSYTNDKLFHTSFVKWFGDPHNPYFGASYDSQSSYPILDSGTSQTVYFRFKNTGNSFWKDDRSTFPGYYPVHLATTSPINRSSAFQASNWLNSARPTGTLTAVYDANGTLNSTATSDHTVQPGQTGEFQFTIYANPNIPGGVYREYFQPVIEGAPGYSWNMGAGVYLNIGVNKPQYKSSYYSQSAYPTIARGSSGTATFKFKNTGTAPWLDDTDVTSNRQPVHLATGWPINRVSAFNTVWPSVSRPNLMFSKVYQADGTTLSSAQHTVQPGQIGEFTFTLSVPISTPTGFYQEHFQPIAEGAPGYSWNMGGDVWLGVTVN